MEQRRTPLAWVESPLQLLGAAEYAAALGRPIAVAYRLTGPQMPTTMAELLDRGALFSSVAPYYGIPWSLLHDQPDWAIGDGFSGQFRMAAAVLRPRSITLLDDGDMSIHLASALLGRTGFARRDTHESGLATLLSGLARDRMLRLAGSRRLTMFSAFADDPTVAAMPARDVSVVRNTFAWLRAHARPAKLPHARVVLGSARVADGLVGAQDYDRWLRSVAASGPVSYLPHRRERGDHLARISSLDGVTVVDAELPAELLLAGTVEPLEVVMMRSSASTTLRAVLEGSGSTVTVSTPAELVR
ncbi:MAG TPA: hypothetical protein VFQ74_00310 [Pseudolysinimonas sp.]|nr:hypothetical protein [Pseudolysinimonas sp.]